MEEDQQQREHLLQRLSTQSIVQPKKQITMKTAMANALMERIEKKEGDELESRDKQRLEYLQTATIVNESDFQNLPTVKVFPNLERASCGKIKNEEGHLLPSYKRAVYYDDLYQKFLVEKGIDVKDEVDNFEYKEELRAHESLGLGMLSMFRSMILLTCLSGLVALFMCFGGLANWQADTRDHAGHTGLQAISIANLDYSYPNCIQQYVTLKQTRGISCGKGNGLIGSIWSTGIVPSTQPQDKLTECPNIRTSSKVDDKTIECSSLGLQNDTLVDYFNQNCVGQSQCDINLSGYVDSADPACISDPARVYIEFQCYLSDDKIQTNQMTISVLITLGTLGAVSMGGVLFYYNFKIRPEFKDKYEKHQVSPEDYSVKMKIPQNFWDKVELGHKNNQHESILSTASELLESQVQQKCSGEPTQIVCINWAHLTSDKIDRLTKRGQAWTRAQYAELYAIRKLKKMVRQVKDAELCRKYISENLDKNEIWTVEPDTPQDPSDPKKLDMTQAFNIGLEELVKKTRRTDQINFEKLQEVLQNNEIFSSVNREKLQAKLQNFFRQVDTDHNHVITFDELHDWYYNHAEPQELKVKRLNKESLAQMFTRAQEASEEHRRANIETKELELIKDEQVDQPQENDIMKIVKPSYAFITFGTLEAKKRVENFCRHTDTRLVPCSAAHQVMWENLQCEMKTRVRNTILFMLFLIAYLIGCFYIAYFVKARIVAIRFDYNMQMYCPEIDDQFNRFGQASDNTYFQYAQLDEQHVYYGQQTGIYQCYCLSRFSVTTFFRVFQSQEYSVCDTYAAMGMGGDLMTMPSGIINAILNNVAAFAISKLVPLIGFHSNSTEQHFTTLSTFFVTFFNMGLLCAFTSGNSFTYLPNAFTDYWLLFWGKAIMTSLVVSNLIPYAAPILKILFTRGFWCCKRVYSGRSTMTNPTFQIERRYANVLNTIYIVFTYSFALPILPIVAAGIFLFQYCVDKLLITYYYREFVLNDELLNKTVLLLVKYGLILFFVAGGLIVSATTCSIDNIYQSIGYSNQFVSCFETNRYSRVLYCLAAVCLLAIVIGDIVQRIYRTRVHDQEKRNKTNYFSELRDLDRFKWLTREYYIRSNFGIRTITDYAVESLTKIEGMPWNLAADPQSYEILDFEFYRDNFQFKTPVLLKEGEYQFRVTDELIRVVYGAGTKLNEPINDKNHELLRCFYTYDRSKESTMTREEENNKSVLSSVNQSKRVMSDDIDESGDTL